MRQIEQRYAGILNAQGTFIARAGLDRKLTYMNDAYVRNFGLKLGDDYLTIVHPDEHVGAQERQRWASGTPASWAQERRCLIKGQWRWCYWQTSTIGDSDGRVIEFQAVGFDVHDRHEAVEALRKSESHYRELADFNRRLLSELDHRVGNNLARLLSLASLMRETCPDVPTFADAISARLAEWQRCINCWPSGNGSRWISRFCSRRCSTRRAIWAAPRSRTICKGLASRLTRNASARWS